ncbi:cholecystokinin receptor type A-like [Mizuhopecten yessoensis]|uniref:Cholecystokinin receptor type A n=1 Tax=Mizuhopecten yessoensis TaxID=6573 RepID=A0A210QD10_MIZYE|nr:cholecystokinin receptor type A-like [Mizuhopecten yessoensis]OWF46624.1 Cholecystokinin receptor type A [Mizuhopecten yessoensis]
MEVFNAANISEDVLAWNSELAMSLVVIDVFLGLYIIFGVFGNVMIIYIYNTRLSIKIDDRIFILALAAVDIVVCVTGPAFSLTRNILPVAFYGNVVCKTLWFFTKAMNAVSVELVLVIGVERYLKICRPFGVQMNSKAKMIILVASVIICFVGHTPIFFFYGQIPVINISRNITGHRCGRIHDEHESSLSDTGYLYLLVIFVLAVGTLGLIVLLYVMIGRRIYKRIKRRAKSSPSKSSEPDPASEAISTTTTENDTNSSREVNSVRKSNLPSNASIQKGGHSKRRRTSSVSIKNWREKHRYSLMFLLIAGICVVMYIPTLIVNLAVNLDSVYFWNYTSPHLRQLYLYFFQVYIVNHVVNPFIYGYFDSAFRTEVKQILCKR